MTARDVLIACCRAEAGGPPAELYPDPDSDALKESIGACGMRARLVSWDDPGVTWGEAGLVVVRSTWDSVDRPAEYVAWAQRTAAATKLVNGAPVIAWNLDKRYLDQLCHAGIPTVPTTWVAPCDQHDWEPPAGEYVVKPSVSAGGRETAWYGPEDDATARAHTERLTASGQTVMVQPHLDAVDADGELSLVSFAGVYSHAFRRGALLQRNGGIDDKPWERITVLGAAEPRPDQTAIGNSVLEELRAKFGSDLVFARVDLIDGPDGRPLVIEVELIEPYLGLTLARGACDRFAQVLVAAAR